MRVLRKGMNGDDVEHWQFFLVGQNHPLEIDGKFGNDTFTATVSSIWPPFILSRLKSIHDESARRNLIGT